MTGSRRAVIALTALCLTASAAQALTIDTLENVTPGVAVTSRVIEGVTVSISTESENVVGAEYDTSSPFYFGGAGANAPLNPGNVSGDIFISQQGGIGVLGDIVFSFSQAVTGFGLTTLDLLESGVSGSSFFELEALDTGDNVIDTDRKTGPQGASGVDVDFFVSSATPLITSVRINYELSTGLGFGFDDLVLDAGPEIPVGAPGALALFGGVLVWLGCSRRTG